MQKLSPLCCTRAADISKPGLSKTICMAGYHLVELSGKICFLFVCFELFVIWAQKSFVNVHISCIVRGFCISVHMNKKTCYYQCKVRIRDLLEINQS